MRSSARAGRDAAAGGGRAAAARELRCPRDRQPLRVELQSAVPVDACRECDGIWLDPGEVAEVAPAFRVDELKAPPRSSLVPRAALPCPICPKGALIPHHYGERPSRVEVGVCDRCGGLWIDAGLMRKVRHARREAPQREAETPGDGVAFPRHPREWFVALTGMPLEVGNPCAIVPWATIVLTAACAAVYVLQLATAPAGALIEEYGLVPAALERGELYRLVTAMFLHVDPVHLVTNLFFLYTFGDNLEERFGPLRYLVLYLACGILGGALSCALGPAGAENTARVGASGAISGLLGAYLVTFPGTRIIMSVPFFRFLPLVIRWRVWAFLLIWVLINGGGLYLQRDGGPYAVDYLAHLGGFTAGIAGGLILHLSRQAELLRADV